MVVEAMKAIQVLEEVEDVLQFHMAEISISPERLQLQLDHIIVKITDRKNKMER
jgi:hypothetical protein